jgi:hypothetical protein
VLSQEKQMINYPYVVFTNAGLLLVQNNKQVVINIKKIKDNSYLVDRAGTHANKLNFIMDSYGVLHAVHYIKFYNTWLSKFAYIHDFIKAECLLESKENLNVKDLKKTLSQWYSGVDRHFGAAPYFMKQLRKLPEDKLFNADLFKSLYNIP